MRRAVLSLAAAATLVLPAAAAHADHVTVQKVGSDVGLPADAPSLKYGDWRFLANTPAGPGPVGPIGVDWETFTRDGKRYVVFSSMTVGLTVLDASNPLKPVRVSDYSSAFGCPTAEADALTGGAQEPATPIGSWENDLSITPDGRFAFLGTDEIFTPSGRCHDPAGGGVEIIDLSDVAHPRLLHLTRNVGQAHSVTVDPHHPWLVWLSSSDGNEFTEILDIRSCLAADRATCRPQIARAVFSNEHMSGIADPSDPKQDVLEDGCHDLRFSPTHAYCAAVGATAILDTTKVVGANGSLTGTILTAGPNACPIIDATRAPGVKVTDCDDWTEEAFAQRGAKGATVPGIGWVRHRGQEKSLRQYADGTYDQSRDQTHDVQISHQAEATDDERIMFVTDERGGGFNFGPGTCPGGAVWFYDIRDKAHPRLMKTPEGGPGIFRTDKVVQTHGNCTAHYGAPVEGERLIVMAWYSQGTHVFRYTPDYSTTPATISFEEVGAYIPAGASTWTSKALLRNPADPEELVVYTTDITRGMDTLSLRVAKQTDGGTSGGAGTGGGSGSGGAGGSGSGSGGKTKVLGTQFNGPLAATGIAGSTLGAFGLWAAAAGLRRRLRRTAW